MDSLQLFRFVIVVWTGLHWTSLTCERGLDNISSVYKSKSFLLFKNQSCSRLRPKKLFMLMLADSIIIELGESVQEIILLETSRIWLNTHCAWEEGASTLLPSTASSPVSGQRQGSVSGLHACHGTLSASMELSQIWSQTFGAKGW